MRGPEFQSNGGQLRYCGPGTHTHDICGASGFERQYILIVPEHDMVVVVTAGARSRHEQNAAIECPHSHILDAVR